MSRKTGKRKRWGAATKPKIELDWYVNMVHDGTKRNPFTRWIEAEMRGIRFSKYQDRVRKKLERFNALMAHRATIASG